MLIMGWEVDTWGLENQKSCRQSVVEMVEGTNRRDCKGLIERWCEKRESDRDD